MKKIKGLLFLGVLSGAIALSSCSRENNHFSFGYQVIPNNKQVVLNEKTTPVSEQIATETEATAPVIASAGETVVTNQAYAAPKLVNQTANISEKAVETKTFTKKDLRSAIKKEMKTAPKGGSKSQLVALLLVLFVGGLGIHRFYLGYTWQGFVQLLTLGGCGVWALIDLIRIAMGTLEPVDGGYDSTL